MNNKETLIKMLRGSVAQLNELSDMTEGIDVYDAAGYVDTEFLMEALSCVNKMCIRDRNRFAQRCLNIMRKRFKMNEHSSRKAFSIRIEVVWRKFDIASKYRSDNPVSYTHLCSF